MSTTVKVSLRPQARRHQVSPYLYSHFAEHLGRCIYGGIWVGEDSPIANEAGLRLDTADALKRLRLPALRWPGGCFADNYHWTDGIGPPQERARRHNLWWNQPETNEFGTDEFMRLCRMIECEPYICLNVGSGTVEEARAWVEYCNSAQQTEWVRRRRQNGQDEPYGAKLWGIGNENWGCGGTMRPEHYADLYRRFATYVHHTAGEGAKLVACGSHPGIPQWDERFLDAMQGAYGLVDHLALHIYLAHGTSDLAFSDEDYYRLIASVRVLEENVDRAAALADACGTPKHRIGIVLDEWGTWYSEAAVATGLYQQNTMRDALFAAASFHAFHERADQLFMTNMAQTVNVLQALVLTDGPAMVVTPTYHVYEMLRPHGDGWLVECAVDSPELGLPGGEQRPAVSASATVEEGGR
ncbi:MAG: alpha-N-arabinofuranosidase, partial [Planctomycetota bacterium]